jgi:hypothetical protein
MKVGEMRISGLVSGTIVLVLGALMMAEATTATVADTVLFFEGVNHGFEFVIGFIAVVVAASITDLSRK